MNYSGATKEKVHMMSPMACFGWGGVGWGETVRYFTTFCPEIISNLQETWRNDIRNVPSPFARFPQLVSFYCVSSLSAHADTRFQTLGVSCRRHASRPLNTCAQPQQRCDVETLHRQPPKLSWRAQNKARRLTSTFEKSRPAPPRTCTGACRQVPSARGRGGAQLFPAPHSETSATQGGLHATETGTRRQAAFWGACFPAPRGRTARTRAHAPPRGRVRVRLWAPCLQAAAPLGNKGREDWLQVKATWWGPGTRQAPHRQARHHFRGRCCGPPGSHVEASTEGRGQLRPPPPRPNWCHGWGSEGRGAPCVWGPATLSGSTASPDSSGNTCHPFSSRAGQRPCPHGAAVEWGTISEDSQ